VLEPLTIQRGVQNLVENLALRHRLAIVQPDGVVRWHRAGFRNY
jgi:hypothetical protein